MNCTNCGEELDPEEEESPQRNKSGNIICDRCYEEKYSYICPICEERFDEDFSKEISPEYILVTENAGKSLYITPGVFKITTYPFYSDGMIEMSLIKTAIRKVADLPEGICKDDIHYICEDCVKEITEGATEGE